MNYSVLGRAAIALATMAALAGCGSFKSMLGLERHVPDETQVVSRPALTLPPDYDLRPPGTATAASGEHEAAPSVGTAGEQSLERSASASGAGGPPREEKGFFGRLFSGDLFGGAEPEDPNQIWRPGQKAAAASVPPDANTTPPTSGPDVQGTPVPPQAAEKPGADKPAAEKPAEDSDKPGFFGRLFGSIF